MLGTDCDLGAWGCCESRGHEVGWGTVGTDIAPRFELSAPQCCINIPNIHIERLRGVSGGSTTDVDSGAIKH